LIDFASPDGEPRFLDQVRFYLKRAAGKTDIPPGMYKYIEACQSVVRFNVPLKMDDGSILNIPCYR
jgi:hypothetical protein